MKKFASDGNRLVYRSRGEELWIEPWGENSLRVRATRMMAMDTSELAQWALEATPLQFRVVIDISDSGASITNGNVTASVDSTGTIAFRNQHERRLLQEYRRTKEDRSGFCSDLNIRPREFLPILGGDYSLCVRFEANEGERLYGMGQYQHDCLDLKGATLELAHRNSQASIPFLLSSLGYGFFWNNPGIGQATFAKNLTRWDMQAASQMDYWITVGDSPAEIEESFSGVVGRAPMMPDYAMGFWQSKLRYRNQDELLEVAREYHSRGLPLSVIVIDFFHWPNQGTWRFDEVYWPDPEAMVRELREMGVEVMVSVWPTVDSRSENFPVMAEAGMLVSSDRGPQIQMSGFGDQAFIDPTNPETRAFVWDRLKEHYFDKGIRLFWLDEAEPEYDVYRFDTYRYHTGPAIRSGNVYPLMYSRMVHDGLRETGQEETLHLVRCAWAGSQKYGALVWSGDIHSSFQSMRSQIVAGLNMGLAGIPWWTTDIGGFYGGDIHSDEFRECLVRWFQYGAFCPVFRLHGDRLPPQPPVTSELGGGMCKSGAANEVWSYGEEAYEILVKYLFMRERLKPYIRTLMRAAHERGTPPMRPLFYDFPDDAHAWAIEDQYMFGPDILVAPVIGHGRRERDVYLPAGTRWRNVASGEVVDGGRTVTCPAPLDVIPLYCRAESDLRLQE